MQETFLRAWRGRDDFDGVSTSGPGCTASPPTSASTLLRGTRPARRSRARRSPRCRGCSRIPTRCSTSCAATTSPMPSSSARDDRAGVPRRAAGAAAATAGGADRPGRAGLAGDRDRRSSSTRAWRRPTARCSGRGRRCRSTCRRAAREWSMPDGASAPRSGTSCARFIDAHERCDAEAAVAIAASDIRITMPPAPMCFDGVDGIAPLLDRAFGPDRDGDWRLRADVGQPHAGGGELPAPTRRHGVPGVQARRPARRRTARSPRSRRSARPASRSWACPTRSDSEPAPGDAAGPRVSR